jgi:hypothetical protein
MRQKTQSRREVTIRDWRKIYQGSSRQRLRVILQIACLVSDRWRSTSAMRSERELGGMLDQIAGDNPVRYSANTTVEPPMKERLNQPID